MAPAPEHYLVPGKEVNMTTHPSTLTGTAQCVTQRQAGSTALQYSQVVIMYTFRINHRRIYFLINHGPQGTCCIITVAW